MAALIGDFRMKKLICFTVIIAALFTPAILFADPFYLFLFGVGSLVLIGGPVAVFGVFHLLRDGGSHSLGRRVLKAAGRYACFIGLLMVANYFAQEHAVANAKAYPEQVAPILEAYRKEHGTYPKSLDLLPSKPPVPRLLRDSAYQSNGQGYGFCFSQPGGFIFDVWCYDMETQTWNFSD